MSKTFNQYIDSEVKREYEILYTLMCQMLGVTTLGKGREFPAPYYRAMIATCLHNKGFSLKSIGAAMGYCPANITSLIRMTDRLNTSGFKELKDTWEKFRNLVARPRLIVVKARSYANWCNKDLSATEIAYQAYLAGSVEKDVRCEEKISNTSLE